MWTVRGQYPTGDVVETFESEPAARAAQRRHAENGVPVAMMGPAPEGGKAPGWCSFCGKSRDQVRGLVAGPAGAGVAICNGCVALCAELLGDELVRR